MASFKAEVYKHHVRRDGTYSIKIRIIHNRKKKYIDTGLVVTKDDVTKGFNLKNYFFIDETEKIIKKYRDICNKNAYAIKSMDVEQVFRLVTETERADGSFIDIVKYGREKAEKLRKNGEKGNANYISTSLNNLIAFVGREQIDINHITAKLLRDWIDWISGARAKSQYPSAIRKLHNEAKREYNVEELGIIKIPLSPFSVVKLPKEPKPKDIDIPVEKVRELFALEDTEVRRYNFARDMFMLSFCLWGTNAKDLYECTEFRDGRLIYNRAKTKGRRDDAALISIKVEPEVIPLFEKYKDKTGKRVFCFYQMYTDSGTFNAAIGKGLKRMRAVLGVDYLVFYSARHSFATILRNDVGIDQYTVHQMLNHVDGKMKITDRYIRKDWSVFDSANRKLLDYVFGK